MVFSPSFSYLAISVLLLKFQTVEEKVILVQFLIFLCLLRNMKEMVKKKKLLSGKACNLVIEKVEF